jgi:single-strand DNA-binding protein
MTSINKAIIVGRVGRDPEKRYAPNADAITTWSVATNRKWKDADGGPREHTEWHNVVAFRQLAEQAYEFLVKGRLVYIEGRLETRSWDDKDTGKKMYRTEIIADTMRMLDSRSDAEGMRASTTGERVPPATATGTTDGYRIATKLAKRPEVDADRPFEFDDAPF